MLVPPEANSQSQSRVFHIKGDSYTGTIKGNVPDGYGKYVWSDGVTYDGEWKQGVRYGFGKLTWPSGARYEGEFHNGYIQGSGTHVTASNVIYKGNFKLNLKHGLGYQVYPNGDVFEGLWVQGSAEGPGKYIWANGNTYSGNMKGGKMTGKGTLTWATGDSFEGAWLDGMMHGFGVYTWIDGSSFIGTWTHGLKDGKGSFYPAGTRRCLNGLRTRGLLPGSTENGLERRWSLEASIEKGIGLDSNEETEPIFEREYMQGVLISEIVIQRNCSSKKTRKTDKDVKRPGELIIKGHRSYDLMICLQLGIRYTVGKITPIQRREVHGSDFGGKASFLMSFPRGGSQLTPPHRSEDFKWKDYCPMVFRNLRELFKIDAADYMMSVCGNDALRELSSPGKSGSIFLLSQDDRFMIKTLRKSELKVLLKMLPHYHRHVRAYDNTLVTKFFGVHRVTPSSGQKFRFVVMGNMFCTELRIHRRFDLKGSSLGRSTDKVQIDENTTLKDLDLNYRFYLEPTWRQALLRQLETDSKFLEAQGIMDYSLLLGVHYRAPHHLKSEDYYPQGLVLVPRGTNDDSVVVGSHIRGSRLRSGFDEVDLLLPGSTARLQIQLGVNLPARAEQVQGEHEVYDVVLYLGVIDILQEYNICKKVEHAFKSLHFDSISISAVDPRFYSNRFLKFVTNVFPPM